MLEFLSDRSISGNENLLANSTVQQIIGREGETATLLSRCPLNFGGLGGGFASRQLRRSAAIIF